MGTGSALCSGWCTGSCSLWEELLRWHCWQRGICPFVLQTQQHSTEQFSWKEVKKQSPATAGACLLLYHIAAVAMAAVIAVGGCSGGPPPPHLLFSLPSEHQAAPMDESVTGSLAAFPVECLASPLPRVSAAAWPFYWPLAAPHNSDTITCSYCTRGRGTSQSLGPVLWVSLPNMLLFLACIRAFFRVMTFLWAFRMQRASFLFLSCDNVKICLPLPIFVPSSGSGSQ